MTINLFHMDCLEGLRQVESESVHLIFADPPYNLSGKNHMTVKNGKPVACNKGDWDIVENIDAFNLQWITECLRVLRADGTLWISGTLHNHPSIGMAMKQLGLWIINDVIWFKNNAPPLLSCNRLAPSTELIWVASKSKKYYFDYTEAKRLNGGKQMRNLWAINAQRHKTPHPAEKPESLLDRIIRIGSKKGDVILDPFMGSGTTGVVANNLKRHFIGFEIDKEFFDIAQSRIKMSGGLFSPSVTPGMRETKGKVAV